MNMRAIVVAVTGLGVALSAQSPAPALDSIRQADLRADLFFLGSDAMRGRLTNTPENLIASEWIKSRFERLGLAPAVPGYFQTYNLMTVSLGEPNTLAIAPAGSAAAAAPMTHGEGWYTHRFSATATAKAGVAFAGYGIESADPAHHDYRAADVVRGRFVLVVDHEPGERDPNSPFDGVVTFDRASALRKAQAAQAAGAVGILFVSDVHNHAGAGARGAGPGGAAAGGAGRGAAAPQPGTGFGRGVWPSQPSRLGTYSLEAWMASVKIPAAQVSTDVAERLIAGSGRTLADLSRAADTPGGIAALPLPGVEVQLTTSVTRHPVPDRNVLAKIEGSDPRLRDDWIVISAHFDHDGATATQILNGADDDGSGTVGLLEIAEAYALAAQQGRRPKRSILFAAFNSEERGLLGAWAYTTQPIAPLDRTVAALNMDMIGRNEEVPDPGAAAGGRGGGRFNGLDPQTAASNANAMNVIGSVRSPDLKAAIDRANAATRLEIKYRYDNNVSQLLRRSDHWPFIQHGVPGVWFFTGLHPDYHQAGDRPERINYEKMERILKLIYQVSWDLADAGDRPALLPRK